MREPPPSSAPGAGARPALDASAAVVLALWCALPWGGLLVWQALEHELAARGHRESLEREREAARADVRERLGWDRLARRVEEVYATVG